MRKEMHEVKEGDKVRILVNSPVDDLCKGSLAIVMSEPDEDNHIQLSAIDGSDWHYFYPWEYELVEDVEEKGSESGHIGVKYDQGKLQWRLLPWIALKPIVEILMFGAKKYSPDNWQKVEPERYKDALMRHLTDWLSGEKNDPESGKSHLAHAGCCLLFLLWFEVTGKLDE